MSRADGLSGIRVVVAGARVAGSSAARALLERGAHVTVTDSSPELLDALHGSVSAAAAHIPKAADIIVVPGLAAPPVGTDLVVTSPGWRPDAPLLAAAARAGIDVIGDVELAWWLDQARPDGPADWLAVTGTNGKTTTVGMLESMLRVAGLDATACGNVGLPVVDAVRAGHAVLAVELSSFQLHWSRSLAPQAAAVLNVSADHLDWHGSMTAYAAAKGRVYADGTGIAVVNVDDQWSVRLAGAGAAHAHRIGFTLGPPEPGMLGIAQGSLLDRAFGDGPAGVVLAAVADVAPPGPHNVANALAAAALARSVGVAAPAITAGLRSFTPGGHRGVPVGEHRGVRYVDDSKATNPHAARAALLAHQSVIWVAGGLLKGADVDELVADTADRMAGAVLLGADRAVIADALARHAPDLPVRVVDSGDDDGMKEVVAAAADLARPGDVVLLAPAAASMDMFTDYAQRGRAFAAAVAALTGEPVR